MDDNFKSGDNHKHMKNGTSQLDHQYHRPKE
jgi:hypothetical protein